MSTHWERILKRSNHYSEMCEVRSKMDSEASLYGGTSSQLGQQSLTTLGGGGEISIYAASLDLQYNPNQLMQPSIGSATTDRPRTSPSRSRPPQSSSSSSSSSAVLLLAPSSRPSTAPSPAFLGSPGGRPRLFPPSKLGQPYAHAPPEQSSLVSRAVRGLVRGRPGPLVPPSVLYLPDGSQTSWGGGGSFDDMSMSLCAMPSFDGDQTVDPLSYLVGRRSGNDRPSMASDLGERQSRKTSRQSHQQLDRLVVAGGSERPSQQPSRQERSTNGEGGDSQSYFARLAATAKAAAQLDDDDRGYDGERHATEGVGGGGSGYYSSSSQQQQQHLSYASSDPFLPRPGSGLSLLPAASSVLLPPSVGGWFSAGDSPPPSRGQSKERPGGGVGGDSSLSPSRMLSRSASRPGSSFSPSRGGGGDNTDDPTPLERRRLADAHAHARKVTLLNARAEKAKDKARSEEVAKVCEGWLVAVNSANYARRLRKKFDNAKDRQAKEKMRNDKARMIQRAWEKFFAPIRARKSKNVQLALMKFSFRLLAKLAVIRKRLAKKRVMRFYADFSRQRFAFVMVKFRYNCVKLQRKIREHLECTRARVVALNKLWLVVESLVRDRVAMEVDAESGLTLHVAPAAAPKRLTGQTYPELARRINKAMVDASLLRKAINRGLKAVATAKQHERLFGDAEGGGAAGGGGGGGGGWGGGGFGDCFIVPEAIRLQTIKTYLTKRRAEHGAAAYIFARSIDVKAKQVDIQSAGLILQGTLDVRSHIDYTVKKHEWPMLMLYSVKKETFFTLVQELVRDEIIRRNKALEVSVKARLERELQMEGAAAEAEAAGVAKRSKMMKAKLSRKMGTGLDATNGGDPLKGGGGGNTPLTMMGVTTATSRRGADNGFYDTGPPSPEVDP